MENIKEISRNSFKDEDGNETVHTIVEMTFEDGIVEEFDIPHFRPSSEKDIQTGLSNRYICEQRRLSESK